MKFKTRADALRAKDACLARGKSIATKAEAEGRSLTAAERNEVTTCISEAKAAAAAVAEFDGDRSLLDSLSGLSRGGFGTATGPNYLGSGLDVKGRLAASAVPDAVGRKSVLEAGSIAVPTPLVGDLRRDGERPQLVVELLPLAGPNQGSDRFRYLRQTTRTNLAAAVAPGDLKPTSIFKLESIEDRTRTIAHLSEPIERQLLDDAATLGAFLASELRYGVMEALDDLVVTGDGTGEDLEGILATPGIQAVAFDTSMLVTTRRAVTALELVHIEPTAWLIHPSDWETLELTKDAELFVMGDPAAGGNGSALPVDRARRRLWGVTVVPTTAAPEGTAVLGNFNDAVLVVREDVRVEMSANVADDFTKNLVRVRAEMRAGLAMLRPKSFAEVDLAAGS